MLNAEWGGAGAEEGWRGGRNRGLHRRKYRVARPKSIPRRHFPHFPTISETTLRAARQAAPRQALQPIAPCVKLVQSSALEALILIKITHGGIDSATSADSA